MKAKFINLIKNIRIKYDQNACHEIKSGKLYPFYTLTD